MDELFYPFNEYPACEEVVLNEFKNELRHTFLSVSLKNRSMQDLQTIAFLLKKHNKFTVPARPSHYTSKELISAIEAELTKREENGKN